MSILSSEWNDVECQNCGWLPAVKVGAGLTGDGRARRELWPSEGARACDWIESNIVCGEGDWYGLPFKLRRDQAEFTYEWYSYCGGCDWWRFTGAIRGEGRGGGKTQFAAALAALDFMGPEELAPGSPNVVASAASFDQANLMYSQLGLAFGGKDNELPDAPLAGKANITAKVITRHDKSAGRIFRVAAKAGTNEGGNPSFLLCDETHEWGADGDPKARLFTVLRMGTTKRKLKCRVNGATVQRGPGRWLMISTAGFDVDNNMLGSWYKRCKLGPLDEHGDKKTLFHWQEAQDGLNYKHADHRALACRQASGAADLIWDVKNRVQEWGKVPSHEWIRYYANRWVEVAEDSWLVDYPSAWPDCADPDLVREIETSADAPGVIAVDMALKHDSVGVVTLRHDVESGRYIVTPKRFMAEASSGRIDHIKVFQYIKAQGDLLGENLIGIAYDPRFFEIPAKELEDDGYPLVEFDQNIGRMGPACAKAFDMIKNGEIAHPDHYPLNSAVLTAAKRETDMGAFTLSKGKSKNKIDLCIAMVMATWVMADTLSEVATGSFNIW